ncbi:hypothetical protein SLA2020_230890 [Shorea laevis]
MTTDAVKASFEDSNENPNGDGWDDDKWKLIKTEFRNSMILKALALLLLAVFTISCYGCLESSLIDS